MKDGRARSLMQESEGWPGHLWLEGGTVVHLPAEQPRPEARPRGPAKRIGPGFLNPAMAPARTRSVMLLADALTHGWLVPEEAPIRVLDALCSTGVRVRRWRQELPEAHVNRVVVTGNDLDAHALDWAIASFDAHPSGRPVAPRPERRQRVVEPREIEGVHFTQEDARVALLRGGWQWIDLDPFGSPMPFLDAALQGMARRGVLEITATDTAALTGSSAASGRRRYGFQGLVDHYAHDDAVRVLLANVAQAAARQDREITPLLALFDGHHVRVSVMVRTSKTGASAVQEHIGWRIRESDVPYRFVRHPTPEQTERGSGPMWTGPLWNASIAGRMTEQRALELTRPASETLDGWRAEGLQWAAEDEEHAARETVRGVRHIADAAELMAQDGQATMLLNLDDLPRWTGTGRTPRLHHLLEALHEAGHAAARAPDLNPFLVTDAPFEDVVQIAQRL